MTRCAVSAMHTSARAPLRHSDSGHGLGRLLVLVLSRPLYASFLSSSEAVLYIHPSCHHKNSWSCI